MPGRRVPRKPLSVASTEYAQRTWRGGLGGSKSVPRPVPPEGRWIVEAGAAAYIPVASPVYEGSLGGGSSSADSGDLIKDFTFGLSLRPDATVALVVLVAVDSPITSSASWTTLASGNHGHAEYWVGYAATPVSDPTFRLMGGDYLTGGVTADGVGQHVAYARAFSGTTRACLLGPVVGTTGTRARFSSVSDSPDAARQQVLGFVPTGTVDVAVLNEPYTDDVWDRLGTTRVSSGSYDFRNAGIAYPVDDAGAPGHFDASSFELFAYRSGGPQAPELEADWVALAVDMC